MCLHFLLLVMVLFQSESAKTRDQVIIRISDNDGKYSFRNEGII